MTTKADDIRHHAITRRLSTTLARILREFSRDFDRSVANKLRERGYTHISLSHIVVFSNMGLGGTRVTELAERARITQQAMGKTLKELEKLGYVQRSVDGSDRRARAVCMTDRGLQLVEDAVACGEEVKQHYARKIGERELEELDVRLRAAAHRLELDYLPPYWTHEAGQ